MSLPQKIIIDTDPGQDDAVAMLLALASPEELEVVGITAVAGNVRLEQNATNALKIVELSGRNDIPVLAGCPGPLRRVLVTAEHVHGKTGLDGPDLPVPQKRLDPRHGVDFIVDTLRSEPEDTVTLVTLGPLTNIATALIKAPDIAARARQIVMMGGAYFQVGNFTPAAEFNIYVDPEAADIVMRSGIPIAMASLDITHAVLSTPERIAAIRALGNRTGTAVADMLGFSEQFDMRKYRWGGAPLHDPCTIAYLLAPELFEGRQINVSIEVASELTRGMSVADYWQITDRPKNVFFLDRVDVDGFFALLTERLARLP
jgi:purine nucleosidase